MKPKICVLYSKSGCGFWRSWQPTQFLQKRGLADIRYIDLRDIAGPEIGKDLHWCDIVSTSGLIGTDGLALVRQYQKLGLKVAVDYDDLYFNVSPFNVAYRTIGVEEVQVRNPQTGDVQHLWQDGKNGFDLKANRIKFHSYVELLKEVDIITTTTIYLKDAMASISGRSDNIHVVQNAVDLNHWKPLDVRDSFPDEFRFGWAVSNSHGEDWFNFKAALVQFLESHPKAKFVCIGDTGFDIKASLPKGQVEWYPFSDLWEYHYPLRMPLLGLDAAVAPLADLEFNKCKSPLKYAEYTAFGWPVIAQKMLPYTECIVNGHNGLLAGTTEEWVSALSALYDSKDLRLKLRFNAMFAIKELFDLEKVCYEWANVYQGAKEIVTV